MENLLSGHLGLTSACNGTPGIIMCFLLSTRKLPADLESVSRWDYCCFCLEMLLDVTRLVDADSINCNAEDGRPILTVQQEREVAKCLQLVVAFGLLPNLMPNVGIPVQKRSKWHNLFASPSGTSEEQVRTL